MCGFTGYIKRNPIDATQRAALERSGKMIVHRGPDDHAVFDRPTVRIEFRRLSIMDVAHGRQPFSDAAERWTCFMNGEIYNFLDLRRDLESRGVRFETECDTEVIPNLLAMEGEAGLRRLNGMFAVVAHDAVENRLLLLRDPFGIKPLYLAGDSSGVAFASELKCFLPFDWVDRNLDLDAMEDYRSHLFATDDRTPFRGVRNVGAGRLLEWSEQGIRTIWEIDPLSLEPAELPDVENPDLSDALCAAVERQLAADVPVGLSLSGGIDSGLLAASLNELGRTDVHAYHIEGVTDLAREDSSLARMVARHFGIELETRSIETGMYWSRLPGIVWMLDEPIGDPAALCAFEVAKIASNDVKVLLMGTGGDELFHGYGHMHDSRRTRACRLLSKWFPPALGIERVRASIGLPGASDRLVRALAAFDDSPVGLATHSRTIWPEASGSRLRDMQDRIAAARSDDRYDLSRRLEVAGYLEKQLLPLADRSSMASSVEGRVPLLDLRFWTDARPHADRSVRRDRFRGKPALRDLAAKWLPQEVVDFRKSGFTNIVRLGLGARPDLVSRIAASSPILDRLGLCDAVQEWSGSSDALDRHWLPVHAAMVVAVWEALFVVRDDASQEPPPIEAIVDRLETTAA